MRLILLGAPGAGKGTQAALLASEFNLCHVATGDLFREAQNKGTELGLLAKSYMEKGQLVPDSVTIGLLSERIKEPDCETGFILDGFPRSLVQAKALDRILAEAGLLIDYVIYIKVAEAELIRRLGGRWICRECQAPYHTVTSPPKKPGKCDRCDGELYQRADDNVNTIKDRLKVYFDQTEPLIDYYQKKQNLLQINGERGIDKVGQELVAMLES